MKNQTAVGTEIKNARIAAGFTTIAAGARSIGVSASNLGNIEFGRHISGETYLKNVLRGFKVGYDEIDRIMGIAGYLIGAPAMPVTAETYAQPIAAAEPAFTTGFSEAEFESIADPRIRVLTRNIATLAAERDEYAPFAPTDAAFAAHVADLDQRIGNLRRARETAFARVTA